MTDNRRPLDGVLVLDCLWGPKSSIGKSISELGATVVRIEPPRGLPDRIAAGDQEIAFDALNIGKRSLSVDPRRAEDCTILAELLDHAALILLDPRETFGLGLDPDELRRRHAGLVVMCVSDFGRNNDFSKWQATDLVLHALSGELAISRINGQAPLAPPARLAMESAASQAVYVALLALFEQQTSGEGALLDFSLLDGACHTLDPQFGVRGSASAGVVGAEPPRGRYPIFQCSDGDVRLCLLSPRQWQGMFKWMGEPAQFADPKFNKVYERFASRELDDALEQFIACRSMRELDEGGMAFGVPIGPVLSLSEALQSQQIIARKATISCTTSAGRSIQAPNGIMEIDGRRAGPCPNVPKLGDFNPEAARIVGEKQPKRHEMRSPPHRPLTGLKVLDLGVIIVGAEQGRLLADQGAEVVKVESNAFPDGSRQAPPGETMSSSFAAGHRNKRSLGLNLRHPGGREIFLRLAEKADVILSNFKPGTLAGLGLDHSVVSARNPGIIMVDSSAFGASGPWAGKLGYGPLVRASTGLTRQWHSHEDPLTYGDSTTVYPDHTASRYGIAGVLSLLIRRGKTERGGTISIAQSEVMLGQMAVEIAKESVGIGETTPDAPWGIYPCAGDDQWCAITVRDDRDWQSLCIALDLNVLAADKALSTRAGRIANRSMIDDAMIPRLRQIDPQTVMESLQKAGVPAGMYLHPERLPHFPYFAQREFFRSAHHPLIPAGFTMENAPVKSDALLDPPFDPAPALGQHTRQVVREWLALDDQEISRLLHEGILEAAERDMLVH